MAFFWLRVIEWTDPMYDPESLHCVGMMIKTMEELQHAWSLNGVCVRVLFCSRSDLLLLFLSMHTNPHINVGLRWWWEENTSQKITCLDAKRCSCGGCSSPPRWRLAPISWHRMLYRRATFRSIMAGLCILNLLHLIRSKKPYLGAKQQPHANVLSITLAYANYKTPMSFILCMYLFMETLHSPRMRRMSQL